MKIFKETIFKIGNTLNLPKFSQLPKTKIGDDKINVWLKYEKEKEKIKYLPREEYEKELQKIIERLEI